MYNNAMKKFFSGLLDWIYKKKCYFCRRSNECVKMCSECYDEMEQLHVTTNRIIEGKNVYCAGIYEKNLQKLIRGLKYHNQPDLSYYLAKFMFEYWQKVTDRKDFQIIPVPIYEKRKKKRKYNHMELVGSELAELIGCTYNPDLIKRIKDTQPQYNLKRPQRQENLKDAFKVDITKMKTGQILLIDDICTTGSTFAEMIKELKKYGIDDIVCFAATTPFGD